MGGAASVASFEGIVDGELGKGGSGHICLDTRDIHRNLATLAHGIKVYGAVASLELTHAGMFANRDLSFFGASSKGIAYGPVECEVAGRTIRPMDEEIIERTIRKFAEGAALAKKCGFRHGNGARGHGWLLHQFLSPKTNTRKDKWGGPNIENRARLVLPFVTQFAKQWVRDSRLKYGSAARSAMTAALIWMKASPSPNSWTAEST
jgi:2,4-dienoyl-CoA reductase-like NADH-dependent reductase (Old Yellow Enzyme family)